MSHYSRTECICFKKADSHNFFQDSDSIGLGWDQCGGQLFRGFFFSFYPFHLILDDYAISQI